MSSEIDIPVPGFVPRGGLPPSAVIGVVNGQKRPTSLPPAPFERRPFGAETALDKTYDKPDAREADRSQPSDFEAAAGQEALAREAPAETGVVPGPAVPHGLALGAARVNGSGLKRLVDVAGASLGLLLLAPFLLLIALLVRLESPGPALFRQRRTGRNGRAFHIYKFRSMRVLEDGPTIVQATRDDDRTTRLGSFLRRSCIDELPQLLNVVKGEMSLVGPRPHALAHDAHYAELIPDYQLRFLVRPGIAGLAQVSGYRGATPTVESMAGRVALDLEYVQSWSFASDVRILMRAVFEGPFSPGAF